MGISKNEGVKLPPFEELEPELKPALDPSKPKMLAVLAKGLAPLPPHVLVAGWCYLSQSEDAELSKSSQKSILEFPERNLLSALVPQFPGWALYILSKIFHQNENVLEKILLHENTPLEVFLDQAPVCSERLTHIIANNQERIIESPEIVPALEKNPNNLKSNTDRLRQFLRLSGIFVPGDAHSVEQPIVQEGEQSPEAPASEDPRAALADEEVLSEEKRMSLHQYILGLSVGARVKLAVKGNKEARGILIRDTNKTVAMSVLKSPRLNDNEIIHYAGLKNVSEDVIRVISRTPGWVKLYPVKLNLINHPKTPLPASLQFIKFLNLRDLGQISKSKTVPAPLRKAAKELLNAKRK